MLERKIRYTKGRIKGNLHQDELLKFIKNKYDKNAECYVVKNRYSNTDEESKDCMITNDIVAYNGFINFIHNGDERSLYYCYSNCKSNESDNKDTTNISLSSRGNSWEIIKDIVSYFGGLVCEDGFDYKYE